MFSIQFLTVLKSFSRLDSNSLTVEVVTVADVDADDHVGNSLLIWELTFGHKAKHLFRL